MGPLAITITKRAAALNVQQMVDPLVVGYERMLLSFRMLQTANSLARFKESYLWAVRIHLVARKTNWSNSSCNRFSEYRGSPCPMSGGREAIVSPQLNR